MSRPYALRRLLELEPLTFREILIYTGWTTKAASAAICSLQKRGEISPAGSAWVHTGKRRMWKVVTPC